MRDPDLEPRARRGITRRGAFASAGAAVGVGLATGGCELGKAEGERPLGSGTVPFYAPHQAGIATPQQDHLVFAAFDLSAASANDLQELLRTWSHAAAALHAGRRVATSPDPGEADGLGAASLTLTFGLGPTLFERDGEDVLGLRDRRPAPLDQIPTLPGDELQDHRSGGDLCVQACANDPQVAFHAIHALTRAVHGVAVPRWSQAGFLPRHRPARGARNLMGFKDGTNNIRSADDTQLRRHVWVGGDDRPRWMQGGSYLVTRRIRMLLDVWDGLTTDQQQEVVGRRKDTGAPLRPAQAPAHAHVTLAAARNNDGVRILRRGYSYTDGVDPATGQMDAGLFFICFQRDPARQFTAIQERLGVNDALAKHLSHTSSAVFACPPGATPGGYVGERLFRRL
jgi:deferrochelatase/peroxidase EfeB